MEKEAYRRPKTDEPMVNGVASVSVFAQCAMTADALATAVMVMGPEEGVPFAEAQGMPVLYLMRTPAGLRETASHTYDRHRMS